MAIARLPVILILSFHLLQGFVEGQVLCSCPAGRSSTSLSSLIESDPRIGDLISKAKFQKQLATQDCKCGNKEVVIDVQSKKLQQNGIGIQEYLNLRQQQQQAVTAPSNAQPMSVDIYPPLRSQNVEISLTPQHLLSLQQSSIQNSQQPLKQQTVNLQSQANRQQNSNLQPANETARPSLSSQQFTLQQQISQSIPVNDVQVLGQQASLLSGIPLTSIPSFNGQLQSLPAPVSQGPLFSNLGLSSPLPSVLSSTSPNTGADQTSQNILQNNAASFCNIPLSVLDGPQNTNSLSISPSYIPSDSSTNIFPQANSIFIPLNSQKPINSEPNSFIDINQIPINSVNYQQIPSQVFQVQQPIQSQVPIQVQQPVQVQQPQFVQISTAPCQYVDESPIPTVTCTSQSETTQSNPTAQLIVLQPTPCQPVQEQPTPSAENQPQSLSSIILSQLTSQYTNNHSPYPSNHGSKSTMKALLPLLFNLLKEKNGGCGCPPNCNCGCMNNYGPQHLNPFMNCNPNKNNFNNNIQLNPENETDQEDQGTYVSNHFPEPHVSDGYSNQIKYGLPKQKEESENFIESVEIVTPSPKAIPKKVQDKKKYATKDYQYQNYKKIKDESIEYDDDYDDSYENED